MDDIYDNFDQKQTGHHIDQEVNAIMRQALDPTKMSRHYKNRPISDLMMDKEVCF